MSTLTTYELNEQIAKRASEKEEFRSALLSDPKKALENEFGVVIPDNLKIEVHQETKNTLHLIVPERDTLELNDDQLDQVAGGVSVKASVEIQFEHNIVYGAPGGWAFGLSRKGDGPSIEPEIIPGITPGIIPGIPAKLPKFGF